MRIVSWYKNRAFLKPRTYHLRYQVHLSTTRTDGWLLLPYPTATDYQSVQNVQLNAAGTVTRHDFYYLIEQPTWAELDCDVTVEPRKINLTQASNLKADQYIGHFDGEFYCQSDNWIQSDDPAIETLARQYKEKYNTVTDLIHALFNHTLETLRYGEPIAGLYTTQQALTLPCVDCGGFSTYLAALCRACQIPTRLISGFWAGHKHNDMHAWLECLLPDGQWLPLDPSVAWLRQAGRTYNLGGFNVVGSDRIVINTGSQHSIQLPNQRLDLGIIQTPLFIQANGKIEYLTNYQVQTT